MKKILKSFLSIAFILTASVILYAPKASADLTEGYWRSMTRAPGATTSPTVCFVTDIGFSGKTGAYIDVTLPTGFSLSSVGEPAWSAYLFRGGLPGLGGTQIVDWNAVAAPNVSGNVFHYQFDNNATALNAGDRLCLMVGTADENNDVTITYPETAGEYTIGLEIGDGAGTSSSGSLTYDVGDFSVDIHDNLDIQLSNYNSGAENVSSVFSFTLPTKVRRAYRNGVRSTGIENNRLVLNNGGAFVFNTEGSLTDMCTLTVDGAQFDFTQFFRNSSLINISIPPPDTYPDDFPVGSNFVFTCNSDFITQNNGGVFNVYMNINDTEIYYQATSDREMFFENSLSLIYYNSYFYLPIQAVGAPTGDFDLALTTNLDFDSDDIIEILFPSEFAMDDINGTDDNHLWDHVDLHYSAGEGVDVSVGLVEQDSQTYLTDNLVHLTLADDVPQGKVITIDFDDTVVDQNPTVNGSYTISVNASNGYSTNSTLDLYQDPSLTIENFVITPANNGKSQAPGATTIDLRTNTPIYPDGTSYIKIELPSDFTMDNINGSDSNHLWSHVTLTNADTSASIALVQDDSSTNLTDNVLTLMPSSTISASTNLLITLDSTVIDQNPSTTGTYTTTVDVLDNVSPAFLESTYDLDIIPVLINTSISLENLNRDQLTGEASFTFDTPMDIDVGGKINFAISNEFVMDEVTDFASHITITANGSPVNISGGSFSEDASNYILELTLSNFISEEDTVVVNFDDTVIDYNPYPVGSYDISLSVCDSSSYCSNTNVFSVSIINGIYNLGITPSNSAAGENPNEFYVWFDCGMIVPASPNGYFTIKIPTDFTFSPVSGTALTDHVSLDGGSFSANSSLLADGTLTLYPNSLISAGTYIFITIDSTIIQQNPTIVGDHEFIVGASNLIANQSASVPINAYIDEPTPEITNILMDFPNTNASEAPGAATFTFDTPNDVDALSNGAIEIYLSSDDFVLSEISSNVSDHVTITASTSGSIVIDDSNAIVYEDGFMRFGLLDSISAGETITVSLDSTVIDQNPAFGGDYEIWFYVYDDNAYAEGYDTITIIGGTSVDPVINITNNNTSEAPDGFIIDMAPSIDIPADGTSTLKITFPGAFVMNDVAGSSTSPYGAHLWNNIAISGDNPVSITENDSKTKLIDNVMTITFDSAVNAGEALSIDLLDWVVMQNPDLAGDYDITLDIYNYTTGAAERQVGTVTIANGGYDYTAGGPTIVFANDSPGVVVLEDGEHSAVFDDGQTVDLSNGLTDGDPTTVVGDDTVGDALEGLLDDDTQVNDVNDVSIVVGNGSSQSNVVLTGPGGVVSVVSGTTITGASDTSTGEGEWDGDFTPASNDDSVSRIGFTKNASTKIGSLTAPLVTNQPLKISLSSTQGEVYYTSNGVVWYQIEECPTDADFGSAGSLNFANACYVKKNGSTVIWSYHLTTFGALTHNAILTLGNSTPAEATGTMDFGFTSGNTISAGGALTLSFPDEFIMPDNADISGSITTFTDDGSNVTVSSASITDNVITINIGSEIAQDSALVLDFASGLITTNPNSAGQYAIALLTQDSEGTAISTGYVDAFIGNDTQITVTVQEALILTIEEGATINLNVDPSTNNGEDFNNRTVLQVKTNAADGYKIQAQLDNGSGAAQLQNGTASIVSRSIFDGANYVANTFTYIAYNNANGTDPLDKTPEELKIDLEAAGSTASFADSSTDMTLYDGTASGVGYSSETNYQNHTIYYLLFVDYLTKAGSYTGQVIYTAYPTF